MLKRIVVPIDPHHCIHITMYRDSRGALVMHLQEGEIDPADPGIFSFMLFSSWSCMVAREKFPRCTKRIIDTFWNTHIDSARHAADQRVKVVLQSLKQESTCTPSV